MNCSWVIWSNLVHPKSGIMGLGVMDISTSSENHENEDIGDSEKVKAKKY